MSTRGSHHLAFLTGMSKGKAWGIYLGLFLGAALIFSRCSPKNPYQSFSGRVYGTQYRVIYCAEAGASLSLNAVKMEVEGILERIDQVASGWREDSEVTRYNNAFATGDFSPSPELEKLLRVSGELKSLTQGAFNVRYGGSGVDLSGIAKGYAVDQVCLYLKQTVDAQHYLVEIGGEVKAQGLNEQGEVWKIGIYTPPSFSFAGETVGLRNTSIATSGQYFKEAHLKSGVTGKSIGNALLSCSVIHPSNATADALATALFVMGAENGVNWANSHGISALFLHLDGTRSASSLWPFL